MAPRTEKSQPASRVDNLPLFACILTKKWEIIHSHGLCVRKSSLVRPEIHSRFSIADHTAVAVKWGLFLPVAALNSPYFTATYLGDELESAEEDGVGGGFAELSSSPGLS